MSGAHSFIGLDALKAARAELLRRRSEKEARAAALRAGQEATARRAAAQQRLWQRAVQGVRPLKVPARYVSAPGEVPFSLAPRARAAEAAGAAAPSAAFSDAFEAAPGIEEAHGWRRAGIGADVLRRLRRGAWRVQAQLDLHGLGVDDARAALAEFVHLAAQEGLRCVRVIHGKGIGSTGGRSPLKTLAARWLQQAPQVRALVQANPAAGGSGALLVLLERRALEDED